MRGEGREEVPSTCVGGCLSRCRQSRSLVLFVVCVALFLDNMLLTTIVPIIPNFLRRQEERQAVGEITQKIELNITNTCIQAGRSNTTLFLDCMDGLNRHQSTNTTNSSLQDNSSEPFKGLEKAVTKSENVRVGLMFASKAIVQLICNPFIGVITNRIGYSIPLFVGFFIVTVSTIVFAFGESYEVLFVARAMQGIGSSCSSVSGLGMLASRYPDDSERGAAMGIALGGLAMGVLMGPPFGGVMYQFTGKAVPFLILAAVALFDGCLQLCVLQPSVAPEEKKGSSLFTLLMDPYILLAAGSVTVTNMGIAMLEPTMPIWMYQTMGAPEWEQGVAFLPGSFAYLVGTNFFGPLVYKISKSACCLQFCSDDNSYRWVTAMIGIFVTGICLFCIPLATQIGHLIVPAFGVGLSIGLVDSAMIPHLAYLVDIRHVSVYGTVYAIADVSFCLGFAIGPAISGSIVQAIGFKWLLWIMGIINLAYAPLMFWIRNPPIREEKQKLLDKELVVTQYVDSRKYGEELLED